MSTQEQEEALVLRGRMYQLEKLAMNRHKVHWEEAEERDLIHGFKEEGYELREAIADGELPVAVWREAADVANSAFMLAANYEKKWEDG